MSQWHRYSIRKGLKLAQVLRLHSARHHWAVLNLRAGVPVAVVQHQLGHASASMTLNVYGAFLPSAADREHWRARLLRQRRNGRNRRGRSLKDVLQLAGRALRLCVLHALLV